MTDVCVMYDRLGNCIAMAPVPTPDPVLPPIAPPVPTDPIAIPGFPVPGPIAACRVQIDYIPGQPDFPPYVYPMPAEYQASLALVALLAAGCAVEPNVAATWGPILPLECF